MKPKTKKTLIIVLAVVAVAVIVWLVARNKKTKKINAVIDALDISTGTKRILKKGVKGLVSNPNFNAELEAQDAEQMGISYEAWVVQRTAAMPGVIELIPTGEYEIIMRETAKL